VRAVVQRVTRARVEVEGATIGAIERGIVAFVGAGQGDEDTDVDYLVNKVVGLRVFTDETDRMTRSLIDVGGALLAVSQFTVFGDVRRGMRPSFDAAMEPVRAEALYDRFVVSARARGVAVATGKFRADMRVFVENDGPVTILIDSKKAF
jgi:D-tyrosyl-tRNA(Tyr) deacylase